MTPKKPAKKKAATKKKVVASKAQPATIKLSTLIPNSKNPRTMNKAAFAKLKQSIERDPDFMAFRPLVYDSDRTILGGNQRWQALKELGYQNIPAIWAKDGSTLTKAQKRRFVLVDNSPKGMAGDWDYDVLANEWSEEELIGMGFELPNESNAFNEPEEPEPDAQPKEIECPSCGYTWKK